MDDRVQAGAGRLVPEDTRPERLAVHAPVDAQDALAECRDNLRVGGAFRLEEPVADGVEVESGEAALGEASQDVRLAAGDASGQADPEHPWPGVLKRARPPAPCSS